MSWSAGVFSCPSFSWRGNDQPGRSPEWDYLPDTTAVGNTCHRRPFWRKNSRRWSHSPGTVPLVSIVGRVLPFLRRRWILVSVFPTVHRPSRIESINEARRHRKKDPLRFFTRSSCFKPSMVWSSARFDRRPCFTGTRKWYNSTPGIYFQIEQRVEKKAPSLTYVSRVEEVILFGNQISHENVALIAFQLHTDVHKFLFRGD